MIEAMKLAIDALENGQRVRNGEGGTRYQPTLEYRAIAALRKAIKQAEQAEQQDVPEIGDMDDLTAAYMSGLYDGRKGREMKQAQVTPEELERLKDMTNSFGTGGVDASGMVNTTPTWNGADFKPMATSWTKPNTETEG